MASGDTLAFFTPAMGEPPATDFATLDIRSGVLVLDFDDTTTESIEFAGFMPRFYDGGGPTATIGYMMTTATASDTADLELSFKSISDDADDLDTKAFAAANTVISTVATASGEVKYQEITFTDGADIDSIAAGEYFRMKFARDASGGTATNGDLELVFIELKET